MPLHKAISHGQTPQHTAELLATLAQRIKQKFDSDSYGVYSFSIWFGRYKQLFEVDGASLDDKAKVRLLLEQMSDTVHESYKRQLLPTDPYTVSFDDTISKLKELYDTEVSSFTLRFQCLKVEKMGDESLLDYTGRVNESCERAEVHKMKADDIKCLIWIFGLKGSNEVELRQRLLLFLDKQRKDNVDVTLQALQKEAQRYLTIKQESAMIQDDYPQVAIVQNRSFPQKNTKYSCASCGKCNDRSTCKFRNATCSFCGKYGHADFACRSSADRQRQDHQDSNHSRAVHPIARQQAVSVTVHNVNASRHYVPVQIRDQSVTFQVDTGADITMISADTWISLGSPQLEHCSLTAQNCDGSVIKIRGKVLCNFELQGSHGSGYAYVHERPTNLLGLDWIHQSPHMLHFLEQMVSNCNSNNHARHALQHPQVIHQAERLPHSCKRKLPIPKRKEALAKSSISKQEMSKQEVSTLSMILDEFDLSPTKTVNTPIASETVPPPATAHNVAPVPSPTLRRSTRVRQPVVRLGISN